MVRGDDDYPTYIEGETYSYCLTNTSGDPCYYYLCDTSICLGCLAWDDYSNSQYIVQIDDNTAVCATVATEPVTSKTSCYISDTYYQNEDYYQTYSFRPREEFLQTFYCVDKDLYYYDDDLSLNTCGDTVFYSENSANMIESFLEGYVTGCDTCSVDGYYKHGLVEATYFESFFIDNDIVQYDFDDGYLTVYPYFAVKTCVAGSDGGYCEEAGYYYNEAKAKCFLCACKFDYCIYCNANECLLYADDLKYYTDYIDLVIAYCEQDPCLSYLTDTSQCETCPTFACKLDYDSDTYDCNFYSYLFINSTYTACSYLYTYTGVRTCTASDPYYSLEDWYGNSYDTTASKQTDDVICIACDYYFISSTLASTCSDSCTNSDPATAVEQYINLYSVGCGVCEADYAQQVLVENAFLDQTYIKTCVYSADDNSGCSIDEYWDTDYLVCQRCACIFENCAACTYDQCTLTYNDEIDISNCTYSDPCIEYEDGSTTNCKKCVSKIYVEYSSLADEYWYYTYKLLIINTYTTICAHYGYANQFYDTAENYICAVWDDYYTDYVYFENQYYAQGINKYCIACDQYFQDVSGNPLCADSCQNLGTGQSYLERSITSYSVGCGSCSNDDYLMQSVSAASNIDGLFIATCSANINYIGCSLTEYFTYETYSCISCTDKFENCAACTSQLCLICAENFYYSTFEVYDYETEAFVFKTQCLFQFCPSGSGILDDTQTCQSCGIDNCLTCGLTLFFEETECTICEKGYSLSSDQLSCKEDSTTLTSLNYYIKTGAIWNTANDDLAASYFYATDSESSPTNPYYFIQQALYDIGQQSLTYKNMNATIYVGWGDHFFFFCDTYQVNDNDLTEYCDDDNYLDFSTRFMKAEFHTDSIILNVVALDCGYADYLGYTDNAYFTQMCIDFANDGDKPVVYVNQPYAYFNLYGDTYVRDIIFTGVNQYVQTKNSIYQLSILPIQYCTIENDPQPGDSILDLIAYYIEDFPIDFSCQSTWPTYDRIPNTTGSTYACSRNSYDEFYPSSESTLTCTGEPGQSDFFYEGDDYVKEYSGIPPRRRNTLFDILTSPEYQSTTLAVPSLTITNCEFEYFANGYDSLINVNNEQIYNVTVTQEYVGANSDLKNEDWEFFIYNGGERGVKIAIYNSTFKHSSFSKGLIVYRKQPVMASSLGMQNLTYLYMTDPLVSDSGSSIFIQNSTFYNLNFLTNVSALSIYGGQQGYSTLYNYLSTTEVEYPTFIHKGIVLNVEDYGGDIEIYNCTFQANMHFIPEVLITNHSSSISKNVESFKDASVSKEYKMATCNQNTYTDTFFFQNGIDQSDDIDAYYDDFERMSTIYISRNRGSIILRDNNFTENIGTFGGAISINSMDRQYESTDTKALVVIQSNSFNNNMAYFSGNAIYIRMTKSLSQVDQVCGGGVLISGNSFTNNIGMKVHNGGAIAASCTLILSNHQDYNQMSSQTLSSTDTIDSYQELTDLYDSLSYQVPTYIFKVDNNEFTENYSGLKGTALYFNYISYPKVTDSTFTKNGPVFSHFEELHSPYYKYFSDRTITYYDEYLECTDEFWFLSSCVTKNNYIDFSHVQGAVYVGHCELQYCIDDTNVMQFHISSSKFVNNQVGPVLDKYFPNNLASQIFIEGGFYNYIYDIEFNENDGTFFAMVSNHSQKLIAYFPTDYFKQQSASLITVQVDPVADYASTVMEFQTVISKCYFKDNIHYQVLGLTSSQVYEGSLIKYISDYGTNTDNFIPIINIKKSYFFDNQFTGPSTSLIYVNNGILYFDSNQATNNGLITSRTAYSPTKSLFTYNPFSTYSIALTQKYGLIKINGDTAFQDSLYHSITSNKIQFSFSEFGSVYTMFLENQYASLSGNTYKYNFASKQGSIMNGLGSIQQSLIVMDDEDISYQFSLNGTIAVTSFSLNTMSLIFNNSQLVQFYSTKGSAINLLKAQKVIIENCVFKQNVLTQTLKQSANDAYGRINHPMNYFIDTKSFNNLVLNNITSAKGQIYIDSVDGSSQNDFADILTQSDSETYSSFVEVNNVQFVNLYADMGSVFYVSNSKLKYYNDENSKYGIFNCSQISSGVAYIDNYGQFVGLNLLIYGSYSSEKGSVLLLSQASSATFTNCWFNNNYAVTQGMAIIEGSSSFSCIYCKFTNNFATDSSIIFADNNPKGEIFIDYSHFEDNTMTNHLFYMIYTTSIIQNSKFINNIAEKVNNGFTMSNSELYLDNVTITYTDPDYLSTIDQVVDTGFININFYSQLNIQNSIVSNVRAKISGVLYATGSSNVTIDKNTIFSNCYSQIGSVLQFISTDAVSISQTSFIDNSLNDIWITNGNATLSKNVFSKGDEQFIYAESSSLLISENTFKNGDNTGITGKAIYCQCLNLTIVNSVFQNLTAAQGGALFITSSSLKSVFYIHDNIFQQNNAQEGGAIYIQDGPFISILNNTYIENKASVISPTTQATSSLSSKGQGGAIYYNCENSNLDLNGDCIVKIAEENTFIRNAAENDGGAIIWITNNFLYDNTNRFIDNLAYYGNDIASYPKELSISFTTNNDYYDPVSNSRRLHDDHFTSRMLDTDGFSKLVSGTAFAFLIYIYDQQGNIYYADSSSIATISASSSDILLKNNEITAVNGVYNFSEMLIYSTPGSDSTLSLDIAGLETYGNDISFIDTPIGISVTFRSCVSGEELTSSSACVACPDGTFSYDAPSGESSCQACSTIAICYGKNISAPLPGYWRANSTTESWVTCPRAVSCLGGNDTDPTGTCYEGYQGTACAVCKDNYSVTSPFVCAECPERIRNIVQISLIMAFAAGYTAFLVKSSMQGANKEKPLYGVYLKVMTNHFQIIGAISNIDFDWPSQIQSFFNVQSTTASVSTQIFSYDCFLFGNRFTNLIGVYYMKLIFYAASPIILTIIAVLYWLLYCAIKKDYSYFKDCMVSTVVILLFLMHPNITTSMFSAFNCIELDGTYYLKGDVGSVCYQGNHLFFLFVVVIPSCILWILGIPLFALLCLYKNKSIIYNAEVDPDTLNDHEKLLVYRCKMKYGFLFTGYRPERYFWEILILYRKIILIMTTVFLSVVSPESQVLVALMVVIVNMFAHVFYEPFYTVTLNKMEMYSLQVASITMYCGLFYITGEHYTYMTNDILKWFFLVCLIIPNIMFFVYWIFFMQIEMIKELIYKYPKIFRIITCCCVDIEKFKKRFPLAEKPKLIKIDKEAEFHEIDDNFSSRKNAEEDSQLMRGPEDINIEFIDDNQDNSKATKRRRKKQDKMNNMKEKDTSNDCSNILGEIELRNMSDTIIIHDIDKLNLEGIKNREYTSKELSQNSVEKFVSMQDDQSVQKDIPMVVKKRVQRFFSPHALREDKSGNKLKVHPIKKNSNLKEKVNPKLMLIPTKARNSTESIMKIYDEFEIEQSLIKEPKVGPINNTLVNNFVEEKDTLIKEKKELLDAKIQ